MFTRILTLSILLISYSLSAQSFDWVHTTQALDDARFNSVVTDSVGNVYAAGSFKLDILDTQYVSSTKSFGNSDVIVAKFDPQGKLLFNIQIGGSDFDHSSSIIYDPAGFFYLSSLHGSDSIFYQKDSVKSLIHVNQYGNNLNKTKSSIAKFDLNGKLIWYRFFESGEFVSVRDIDVDDSSNVILVGRFTDTLDFGRKGDTVNLASTHLTSGLLVKLDSSGKILDAFIVNGVNWVHFDEIEIDANNNYTLAGAYSSTVDLDPDSSFVIKKDRTSMGFNSFIAQYSSDLKFKWGINLETKRNIINADLEEFNNAYYLIGGYQDTTYFDHTDSNKIWTTSVGMWNSFVSKYNNKGNWIWTKSIGDSSIHSIRGIELNDENIYLTGVFRDVLDMDPNPGVFELQSYALTDLYIANWDTNGYFKDAINIGENGSIAVLDIHITNQDLYFTGHFIDSIDFDPDTLGKAWKYSSSTNIDAFILNLKADFTTALLDFHESKSQSNFKLYPNPTDNWVKILSQNKFIYYSVFNVTGSLLINDGLNSNNRIDLSGLGNGNYVLQLQDLDGNIYQSKFIKVEN